MLHRILVRQYGQECLRRIPQLWWFGIMCKFGTNKLILQPRTRFIAAAFDLVKMLRKWIATT